MSTTVRVEHIFEHKQPPTHTTRAFYYATIYFERERKKKQRTTNESSGHLVDWQYLLRVEGKKQLS